MLSVVHNRNEASTRRLLIGYEGKDKFMRKKILLSIFILTLETHLSAGVWPGETWQTASPESQGVDSAKLNQAMSYLASKCGSHGTDQAVVIRNGYMIWKGSDIGNSHNVWSASEAFNYNDYQMALFWDTLFLKVYGAIYDTVDSAVLHPMPTDILQCQDNPTFVASGHACKGSLGVSVRDFARFGLLYLRKGNWKGKQLINAEHATMVVASPLPATLPNSVEELAEVIPGQRTIGRVARVQKQGPHRGSYSWLWWTNGLDRTGQRFYPDAPVDLYGAFGKNGNVMAVIPSLDLVASWSFRNTATVARRNEAFKRLVQAVTDTRVSIVNNRWHINGAVTYPGAKAEGLLMNVRMVNCTFEDLNRPDFDAEANTDEFITRIPDYMAHGVRAFTVKWIKACGFTNVVLEINNEYPHKGFDHRLLRTPEGVAELIRLARRTAPDLFVSASGYGDGRLAEQVTRASDFLLIHFNGTPLDAIPGRIAALKRFGKPIVCNEDVKVGAQGAKAAESCVANGASWGLMLERTNQHFPFTFNGAADDAVVYAKLKELTSP